MYNGIVNQEAVLMKKSNFQKIKICPTTSKTVPVGGLDYYEGVCHHCGHNNGNKSTTHAISLIGFFSYPSLYEIFFKKMVTTFTVKDPVDPEKSVLYFH